MKYMAALKKIFSNRPFMGTLCFLIFIYLFEEFLFDFPQIRYFQLITTYRPTNEVWLAVASGIGSFVILFLIVWSALVSSRGFQVLYIFMVALAFLVQYGFWKALGRFLATSDLQIAFATPLNIWQGAGTLYFDWRFMIPLIGFIITVLLCRQQRSRKSSLFLLGSTIVLIVSLKYAYTFTDLDLRRPMKDTPNMALKRTSRPYMAYQEKIFAHFA